MEKRTFTLIQEDYDRGYSDGLAGEMPYYDRTGHGTVDFEMNPVATTDETESYLAGYSDGQCL